MELISPCSNSNAETVVCIFLPQTHPNLPLGTRFCKAWETQPAKSKIHINSEVVSLILILNHEFLLSNVITGSGLVMYLKSLKTFTHVWLDLSPHHHLWKLHFTWLSQMRKNVSTNGWNIIKIKIIYLQHEHIANYSNTIPQLQHWFFHLWASISFYSMWLISYSPNASHNTTHLIGDINFLKHKTSHSGQFHFHSMEQAKSQKQASQSESSTFKAIFYSITTGINV